MNPNYDYSNQNNLPASSLSEEALLEKLNEMLVYISQEKYNEQGRKYLEEIYDKNISEQRKTPKVRYEDINNEGFIKIIKENSQKNNQKNSNNNKEETSESVYLGSDLLPKSMKAQINRNIKSQPRIINNNYHIDSLNNSEIEDIETDFNKAQNPGYFTKNKYNVNNGKIHSIPFVKYNNFPDKSDNQNIIINPFSHLQRNQLNEDKNIAKDSQVPNELTMNQPNQNIANINTDNQNFQPTSKTNINPNFSNNINVIPNDIIDNQLLDFDRQRKELNNIQEKLKSQDFNSGFNNNENKAIPIKHYFPRNNVKKNDNYKRRTIMPGLKNLDQYLNSYADNQINNNSKKQSNINYDISKRRTVIPTFHSIEEKPKEEEESSVKLPKKNIFNIPFIDEQPNIENLQTVPELIKSDSIKLSNNPISATETQIDLNKSENESNIYLGLILLFNTLKFGYLVYYFMNHNSSNEDNTENYFKKWISLENIFYNAKNVFLDKWSSLPNLKEFLTEEMKQYIIIKIKQLIKSGIKYCIPICILILGLYFVYRIIRKKRMIKESFNEILADLKTIHNSNDNDQDIKGLFETDIVNSYSIKFNIDGQTFLKDIFPELLSMAKKSPNVKRVEMSNVYGQTDIMWYYYDE